MKTEVVVTMEMDTSYGGHPQRSLFLMEKGGGNDRCISQFEWQMSLEEQALWSGKVTDKSAVLVINRAENFHNGYLRVKGRLEFPSVK